MATFDQVLVPVDFSTHSAEAIRVAADMARRYESSLTLLHVIDPLSWAVSGYDLEVADQRGRLAMEAEKSLASAKRAALAAGANVVQTRVVEGAVAPSILDEAKKGPCDLVILGTHGRTGIKRAVLGSVAEAVVRSAPCPVLVVKGEKDVEAQVAAESSRAAAH